MSARCFRDVEYARVGEQRQLLDLYLPEPRKISEPSDRPLDVVSAEPPEQPQTVQPAEPYPVVVWIHGGAWQSGDKEPCPAALLIPRGYAAVGINYRLSDSATFPAQIHDCKAAVRWVRAHAAQYNLDPDRIGVWGASAGGHLAALLGVSGDDLALEGDLGRHRDESSRVQAVCDWYAPTDLVAMLDQAEAHPADGAAGAQAAESGDTTTLQQRAARAVARFLGPVGARPNLARLASPVSFATPDDPPFLIMHGDQDRIVPFAQSAALHNALRGAGVQSRLHVVRGTGHGFTGDDLVATVADFFDVHLRPSIAAHP